VAVAVLPVGTTGDVSYDATGKIVEGRDLESNVFLSLFLDAPAQDGDDVPAGTIRRGFWADAFSTDGDITGSRLWLLDRAKVTATSLADAKMYAEEALAWLIRDGIARSVSVTPERFAVAPETQGILLRVFVYSPTGERFAWAWDALTTEEV
jgi:phage gp46-like protein